MTTFLGFSCLILILMAFNLPAQPKLFRVEAEQLAAGTELTILVYITKIAVDDIPRGSANSSFFLTAAPSLLANHFIQHLGMSLGMPPTPQGNMRR